MGADTAEEKETVIETMKVETEKEIEIGGETDEAEPAAGAEQDHLSGDLYHHQQLVTCKFYSNIIYSDECICFFL